MIKNILLKIWQIFTILCKILGWLGLLLWVLVQLFSNLPDAQPPPDLTNLAIISLILIVASIKES